jgi:hypothetical protein
MPTAEEVLSETYASFMRSWGIIGSLRQVTEVALPVATEQLLHQNGVLVEAMSKDADYKKIIVSIDGYDKEWSADIKKFFQTGLTTTSIENFTNAIDAASIVFAQSVLDDCALSLLRVCALASPADWEQFVKDRKVDFNSVKEKSSDTIREELVNAKIDQLGMESLKKKIDILFALTKPEPDFDPVNNYKYDVDQLERIDKLRQAVIHHGGIGKAFTGVEGDLQYIKKTVSFLIALVNKKYGVRIDPKALFPTHGNVAAAEEIKPVIDSPFPGQTL